MNLDYILGIILVTSLLLGIPLVTTALYKLYKAESKKKML